ncbi:MAG: hypothetical protein QOG03_147, partial [Actinomycetota bacterium]|nr:hypothetical protein [Actinomycetota bacterium]
MFRPVRARFPLTLAALAVAGAVVVIVLCIPRIRVSPDSVTYLGVAHNVTHGKGLTVPFRNSLDPFKATVNDHVAVTQWPPGYPLLLAPLVGAGLSGPAAAEVVNVAAMMALVVFVGLTVRRATGHEGWALAAAAVIIVAGEGVTGLGGRVLSDLPFAAAAAAFTYVSVGVLTSGTDTSDTESGTDTDSAARRRRRIDGAALVLIALVAGSLRIAAVSLAVPALVIALRTRRWVLGLATAAAAVALPALLLVTMPRQAPIGHPFGVTDTFGTPGYWALPSVVGSAVAAALGIAICGAAAIATVLIAARVRRARPLALVTASVAAGYAALLVYTRVHEHSGLPWDRRIMAPFFVVAVMALATLATRSRLARVA